ncbi:hypothetical protein KR018_008941, partial [Drosophila ironensis]
VALSTWDNEHFCSGSILSESIILTAGHCVVNEYTGFIEHNITIRAGSSHSQYGGQLVNVSKSVPHEDFAYDATGYPFNDIAVLILEQPLEFGPKVQKIHLAKEAPKPGTNLRVNGWNSLHKGIPACLFGDWLFGLGIKHKACTNGTKCVLQEALDAALVPGCGKNACNGNSGDPLVTWPDPELVGVVSFGKKCVHHPVAYANVVFFRGWIIDTINNNKLTA